MPATQHKHHLGDLSPDDFERLIYWLVKRSGDFNEVQQYGGARDKGRDVVAYKHTVAKREKWYIQCKRYQSITYAVLRGELDKLAQHAKKEPDFAPDVIVFATACRVPPQAKDQAAAYARKLRLPEPYYWGRLELDEMLKAQPEIEKEFFATLNAAGLQALRQDLQAGKITLATGERAVALGGDRTDALIVTGDDNVILTLKGTCATTIRQALMPLLHQFPADLPDLTGREREVHDRWSTDIAPILKGERFQLDNGSLEQIYAIREKAQTFMESGTCLPDFTLHDIIHSDNLIELVDNLLTALNVQLDHPQGFILAAAAYLHDIGMYIRRGMFEALLPDLKEELRLFFCPSCNPYSIYEPDLDLNDIPTCIRAIHNLLSGYLLRNEPQLFGIDDKRCRPYKDLIIQLCVGHRKANLEIGCPHNEINTANGSEIPTGALTAILRCCDGADFRNNRAPENNLGVNAQDFLSRPVSLEHWLRHFFSERPEFTLDRRALHCKLHFRMPQTPVNDVASYQDFFGPMIEKHVRNFKNTDFNIKMYRSAFDQLNNIPRFGDLRVDCATKPTYTELPRILAEEIKKTKYSTVDEFLGWSELQFSQPSSKSYFRELERAEKPGSVLQEEKDFNDLASLIRQGKCLLFVGPLAYTDDKGAPPLLACIQSVIDYAKSESLLPDIDFPQPSPEWTKKLLNNMVRFHGRPQLVELMKQSYRCDSEQANLLLLPYLENIDALNRVILTTNWDSVLEQKFNTYHHGLASGDELSGVLRNRRRQAIVHLTGDLDSDLVIPGQYYETAFGQISKLPLAQPLWDALALWLRETKDVPILIGFSPNDPSLELLFKIVGKCQCQAYAVMPYASKDTTGRSDWPGNLKHIQTTTMTFLATVYRQLKSFADREEDLKHLSEVSEPDRGKFCFQLSAHYGMGKSDLLEELKRIYTDTSKWTEHNIKQISLKSHGQSHPPNSVSRDEMVEVIGTAVGLEDRSEQAIGQWIQKQERLLFLIDDVECLDETGLQAIYNCVLPSFKSVAQRDPLSRVIMASRRPFDVLSWEYSDLRNFVHIRPLSPLTLNHVRELIRSYSLGKKCTHEWPESLVRQIYDISGRGNIRFVKVILTQLFEQLDVTRSIPEALEESQVRCLLTRFSQETDESGLWIFPLSDSERVLKRLFDECLCLLRVFDFGLLDDLAKHPDIEYLFGSLQVEESLGRYYKKQAEKHCLLDSRTTAEYWHDPVLRRIKTTQLKYHDPDSYERGISAIENALRRFITELDRSEVQVRYMLEWLYTCALQLEIVHPNSVEKRWSSLRPQIEQFHLSTSLTSTAIDKWRAIRAYITGSPGRDWEMVYREELQDSLVRCLGKHFKSLDEVIGRKAEEARQQLNV